LAQGFRDLDAALEWLGGHVDYERTSPTRRDVPTLEPVADALAALGDPHRDAPFVHVTGTNGKGSTTAITAALLTEAGRRVGTFTSPDLHVVNERLSVAGNPIDDDALVDLLGRLRAMEAATGLGLTRFELLTVGALLWFSDEGVDAGVVEVGLGGTWDSTNVIDGSVSVVTNVSLDHTEVLGDTVELIATDKAGIIKPGSTAVLGDRAASTLELQSGIARSNGAAALWRRGEEFSLVRNELAVGGRLVTITTPFGNHRDVGLSLHGAHQGDNASCALAAAEAFLGCRVDADVVAAAFAGVRIPGRLEVLGTRPLVVVDGAHNPAGTKVLADALAEEYVVAGTTSCVVGALRNRDATELLAPLARLGVARAYCCRADSPRALDAASVAAAASALGMAAVVVEDPGDAIEAAIRDATPDDLVVATGSFYVVGAARGRLLGLPGHRG